MELTAADGVEWVAYIDGVPVQRRRGLLRKTVLPGRRLRFDSATESRVSLELPAGSPFLREPRLLALLAASRPFPEPVGTAPAGEPWWRCWQARISGMRPLVARAREAVAHAAALAVEALLHGPRVRS
jgi:hypothetical protein